MVKLVFSSPPVRRKGSLSLAAFMPNTTPPAVGITVPTYIGRSSRSTTVPYQGNCRIRAIIEAYRPSRMQSWFMLTSFSSFLSLVLVFLLSSRLDRLSTRLEVASWYRCAILSIINVIGGTPTVPEPIVPRTGCLVAEDGKWQISASTGAVMQSGMYLDCRARWRHIFGIF